MQGIIFRDNKIERVSLPETVGEVISWYKSNVSCDEPDILNISGRSSIQGVMKYVSCVYDPGNKCGDIVVFKTISFPSFDKMEERVFSLDTDETKMIVDYFRKQI